MERESSRDTGTTAGRVYAAPAEIEAYQSIQRHLQQSPVAPHEVLGNLELFLTRSALSRILFIHQLYRQILDVHGVIMEFGVRWGRNLALFTTLRSMYEPYNLSRRIVGFDTFEGFPSVSPPDGAAESVAVGQLSVIPGYETYLESLLAAHEQLAPRSNVKKHELVKGDLTQTLPRYLGEHPETIVAMAYFDLDLYEPTKIGLEAIKDRLVRGSVIAFDELALAEFPGETAALRETFGLNQCELKRDPTGGYQSYFVCR